MADSEPLAPMPGSQPSERTQTTGRNALLEGRPLRPEEREYFDERTLKKPLGVLQIWALGVGVVITGEYFGWNPGLKEGGPLGMLLASLFVCLLYITWVLALSELSVAMPFAGGPMAYGRRASGPVLGFVMGWSMFLESLFATIGTAVATGGALYFLVDLVLPDVPRQALVAIGLISDAMPADEIERTCRLAISTFCGLVTVVLFAALQCSGAKEQAKVMEWMTYGAIGGLVWFWIACVGGIRMERILTQPLLVNGWAGAVRAIPYAIWWLVIIETVALAAEEAHEPHRSIPRGMMLAQVTLIVLVVLTWFIASAAGDDYVATADVPYPLQHVYRQVWPDSAHLWHLIPFSIVAICGMTASYNGMIYAVSRQSFSLGRAGYLPQILGRLHPVRRTPDVSIVFWSLVIAGFVIWGYFNEAAVMVAVLTCNLTALLWYILAMVCLFLLRIREPEMHRPYRVPLYPFLPALVIVLSLIAVLVYGWLQEPIVLWLTGLMYAAGLGYFLLYARNRLVTAAPEEISAMAPAEADRDPSRPSQ